VPKWPGQVPGLRYFSGSLVTAFSKMREGHDHVRQRVLRRWRGDYRIRRRRHDPPPPTGGSQSDSPNGAGRTEPSGVSPGIGAAN